MGKRLLAENTHELQSFWLFTTPSRPISLNATLPNRRKLTLKKMTRKR